jgi:exosortase/archaeosortase family protein
MIARRRSAKTRAPETGVGDGPPPPDLSARDRTTHLFATLGNAPALWRASAVVLCVIAAYSYSLQTLVQEMGQESPLAYLGLIPFIALLLAVILARPRRGEPDVHDRYLDYIVGVPLLILAMALLTLAPAALPSVYWLHRLDLLSLPLFVAGAIALAFGVRALLRVRAAVVFLFLAWPYPYVVFLDHELSWFTDTTAAAVKKMLNFIPVASVQPDGDFLVSHITGVSRAFSVSVSSACSGINSGLGFLIVGSAAAILMRGRRSLKLLWLAVGTALMFAVNVGRILLVLGAGRAWGEQFAIDVLHPALGLVMILGATLVMLLLLPRFHLSLDLPARRRSTASGKPAAMRTLAVRRARIPLVLLAGVTVAAMFANANMSRYELLSFGLGPSRLSPSSLATAPVAGWTLSESAIYPWATRYFGSDGSWTRYTYVETSHPSDSAAPAAITVDVIGTSDLGTFSTYGLEACYGFHNYALLDIRVVDLGGGLNGKILRYVIPGMGGGYWLGLYWEWPVSVTGNERYQRVVLSVDASLTSNEPDQQRLISLARELVQRAASEAATAAPGAF